MITTDAVVIGLYLLQAAIALWMVIHAIRNAPKVKDEDEV